MMTDFLDLWRKLPKKAIFFVIVCFALFHLYFIDGFDYGTHESASIDVQVSEGSHIPGPFEGQPQHQDQPEDQPEDQLEDQLEDQPQDDAEYVAICMAVKDQSLDLPEFFIHHYYNIGIRRFYIMDDASNPPLSSISDYGIPNSALTFHYYNLTDHVNLMQLNIYNQCNEWYGGNHTWIAYFDADEFLEITTPNETLHSILKGFESDDTIGAVGVNWRMHTSSDLKRRPESNRKGFQTCIYDDEKNNGEASDNKHVKSIVKTSKYVQAGNPHVFSLVEGANWVGEDGKPVNHYAFRQPITRNRLSLHHYAVKSLEEYEAKMNRSNAMGDPKGWEFWNHVKDMPHVDCPEMAKYDP